MGNETTTVLSADMLPFYSGQQPKKNKSRKAVIAIAVMICVCLGGFFLYRHLYLEDTDLMSKETYLYCDFEPVSEDDFPEDVDGIAYAYWENPDNGSLDMIVIAINKTDMAKSITDITVTLTDEELGEVAVLSTKGDIMEPVSSKTYYLHADKSEVRVGMESWGSIWSDCIVSYE